MKAPLAISFLVVLLLAYSDARVLRRQAPPQPGQGTSAPLPSSPAVTTEEQQSTTGQSSPQPTTGQASPQPTTGQGSPQSSPASPEAPSPSPVVPTPAVPEEAQGRAAAISPRLGAQSEPSGGVPAAPSVFTLPSGANLIVGQINGGFTCNDKIYGYYADTNNDCKIFHVCVPIVDEEGHPTQEPLLYSFFCNNGTIFNQESLVCDYTDNFDCSLATNYYRVNEEFGKIPTESQQGRSAPVAAASAPVPQGSVPQPPAALGSAPSQTTTTPPPTTETTAASATTESQTTSTQPASPTTAVATSSP